MTQIPLRPNQVRTVFESAPHLPPPGRKNFWGLLTQIAASALRLYLCPEFSFLRLPTERYYSHQLHGFFLETPTLVQYQFYLAPFASPQARDPSKKISWTTLHQFLTIAIFEYSCPNRCNRIVEAYPFVP